MTHQIWEYLESECMAQRRPLAQEPKCHNKIMINFTHFLLPVPYYSFGQCALTFDQNIEVAHKKSKHCVNLPILIQVLCIYLSYCIYLYFLVVLYIQGVPLQIVPFSIRGNILNKTQIENLFWHQLDKNVCSFC